MSFQIRFNDYYKLTKPGIIRGNLITAIAGYLLGAQDNFQLATFLGIVFGTIFVIGSGCVFNNYFDRDIDAKMKRTKNRALVTNAISTRNALIFSTILGVIGVGVLYLYTNVLTLIIGITGLFFYVAVYGVAKRYTSFATETGSIPGAISILAGYTAASNTINSAAILLFAIMVIWQMPHFYSIAMYRIKDYTAANIPVLPRKIGNKATRFRINIYVIIYILVASSLTVFGVTGYVYLLGMTVVGLLWLYKGLVKKQSDSYEKWALGMFKFSLLVLLVFSVLISVDTFIP